MHSYVLHVEQPCLYHLLSGWCVEITAMIRTCVQVQSEFVQNCVVHTEQLCLYKPGLNPGGAHLCICACASWALF